MSGNEGCGTAGTMLELAEQAADAFAAAGLVFIEDDKLDALATILHAFLIAAGLTLHETGEGGGNAVSNWPLRA